MSVQDIIRAWKDERYRVALGAAALGALPENPAGLLDLTDAELDAVLGAQGYVQGPGGQQFVQFQGGQLVQGVAAGTCMTHSGICSNINVCSPTIKSR